MIVPTRPPPMHEDISHVLLFLRGNLAFFRHSPRVVDVFFRYDALKNLDAFFAWDGVSADAGTILLSMNHAPCQNSDCIIKRRLNFRGTRLLRPTLRF